MCSSYWYETQRAVSLICEWWEVASCCGVKIWPAGSYFWFIASEMMKKVGDSLSHLLLIRKHNITVDVE